MRDHGHHRGAWRDGQRGAEPLAPLRAGQRRRRLDERIDPDRIRRAVVVYLDQQSACAGDYRGAERATVSIGGPEPGVQELVAVRGVESDASGTLVGGADGAADVQLECDRSGALARRWPAEVEALFEAQRPVLVPLEHLAVVVEDAVGACRRRRRRDRGQMRATPEADQAEPERRRSGSHLDPARPERRGDPHAGVSGEQSAGPRRDPERGLPAPD